MVIAKLRAQPVFYLAAGARQPPRPRLLSFKDGRSDVAAGRCLLSIHSPPDDAALPRHEASSLASAELSPKTTQTPHTHSRRDESGFFSIRRRGHACHHSRYLRTSHIRTYARFRLLLAWPITHVSPHVRTPADRTLHSRRFSSGLAAS